MKLLLLVMLLLQQYYKMLGLKRLRHEKQLGYQQLVFLV
jgi:hypothetical protein